MAKLIWLWPRFPCGIRPASRGNFSERLRIIRVLSYSGHHSASRWAANTIASIFLATTAGGVIWKVTTSLAGLRAYRRRGYSCEPRCSRHLYESLIRLIACGATLLILSASLALGAGKVRLLQVQGREESNVLLPAVFGNREEGLDLEINEASAQSGTLSADLFQVSAV